MPQKRSFFKTRIAPTPSGYLHAGNALNFLLVDALAKKSGANVLLRIDDQDRERYRAVYAQDVFDTLRFLHIQWNDGPKDTVDFEERWSQQRRIKLYEEALQTLRANNAVFACTCSRTQAVVGCKCREKALSLDLSNAAWRLVTNDESIAVKNIYGAITNSPLPDEMKNFIVKKKDGLPAYQLSSLVDDLHFGIDLIIRGEDLWPSTLAQLYLAKQLGESRFAGVAFFHHPLLKNGGEKLSKSAGAASVKHWRESGKTLAEFLQYLGALLHTPVPVTSAEDLLAFFAA